MPQPRRFAARQRSGPFVLAATLCKRTEESDEGFVIVAAGASLIRVQRDAEGAFLPGVVTLAIIFNGGSSVGTHRLRFEVGGTTPIGILRDAAEGADIVFSEPYWVSRSTVVLQLFDLIPGMFWIDVFLGDRFMSRIPFQVKEHGV